jgi:hypothetical protein
MLDLKKIVEGLKQTAVPDYDTYVEHRPGSPRHRSRGGISHPTKNARAHVGLRMGTTPSVGFDNNADGASAPRP